jgi:hypothetical protein
MDVYRMLVCSFHHMFEKTNLTELRVVVYSPQIIENYQLQSGEALSVCLIVP